MNLNDQSLKYIKIILLCSIFIFFLIGFLIGYLIYDDSCSVNPFIYGTKKLNEKNEDKIICSCTSTLGKTEEFYFDEEKIAEGKYLNIPLD